MYKIISVSNHLPNVDTTDFSSNNSLTDYDIVIVDSKHVISSFPKSSVEADNKRYISQQNAHILLELMNRRQSEISALLNKGKIIISFLDPLFNVKLISSSIKNIEVNNYSWIPNDEKRRFVNRLIDGSGTGLSLFNKNHLFAPYFFAFQKEINFKAYVDIPVSGFDLGDAFISNSADLTVGFSFSISKGIVVILPRIDLNEENASKFIGVLLQIAKKHFGADMKTPAPEWVKSFEVPGVDLLVEQIKGIEKNIKDLESQKSKIDIEKNNLDEYKLLLFEQGHVLEKKVVDSLLLMGFRAETVLGENTDFDVILESEEGRAIAEVEGRDDGAIHKGKIDQLLSAINQDAEARDFFAKGILIGNHYRLKSVNERDQPFTETVLKLSRQYHYALLTTLELYLAVVYFLVHPEDESTKKACRKALFEADGEIVKFPLP